MIKNYFKKEMVECRCGCGNNFFISRVKIEKSPEIIFIRIFKKETSKVQYPKFAKLLNEDTYQLISVCYYTKFGDIGKKEF